MNIQRFSITKKEIFLLATAVILLFTLILQIPLPVFNAYHLLLITIITFIAKGFFPDTRGAPLYFLFIITMLLTLYYPIFHVILIYFIAIIALKALNVI